MDKKVTALAGIALGATLIASASFGIYKWIKNKTGNSAESSSAVSVGNTVGNKFSGGFLGNGLVKSNSLYGGATNGLVGGGLFKG
ncbi:hypothetical protein [Spirosoma oryzicola]|uniref:hypothetical protein n=1 Tax=Spirosoma oryzicola TaxID=2898794 RepID=UPI001E56B5AF|nr:hypothetical protein [Spirosoma oryzicola]UHG93858.1 hypothetical protein LQ777_25395 [Spirosoma oryzicola]